MSRGIRWRWLEDIQEARLEAELEAQLEHESGVCDDGCRRCERIAAAREDHRGNDCAHAPRNERTPEPCSICGEQPGTIMDERGLVACADCVDALGEITRRDREWRP